MLLEVVFMKQQGAKDKLAVEEQTLQIKLVALMLQKGAPRFVELGRKGMLQLQEWRDVQKWMAQLDLQI